MNTLSIQELRARYHSGFIQDSHIHAALIQEGFLDKQTPTIQLESRIVSAEEVLRLHVVYEFMEWDESQRRSILFQPPQHFRQDLPTQSRQAIIERTIKDCELCRHNPEKAYIANLWKSILAILQPSKAFSSPHRNVWPLFYLAQFLELSPIDLLDFSFHDYRALLRLLERCSQKNQYRVWNRAMEISEQDR